MTKFTNKHDLPSFIFSALTKEYYDGDKNSISATNLINSPRYTLLQKRHHEEIEEDISDNVWKIFGSAVHIVFDTAARDAGIGEREERLHAEVDGIKISGKFDILEDKIITDYKVTSVWQVILNDPTKWTQQLNIYVWLCKQHGKPVEALQTAVIFRDWRRGEAEKNQDYPPLPIMVYKLPLMEDVDAYVKERVALYKDALDKPDNKLDICTPEDRWKSEDTFAIYKNENKTATRVFDKREDAENLMLGMQNQYAKDKFKLVVRPGTDKRCINYCPARSFCSYWIEKYKGVGNESV